MALKRKFQRNFKIDSYYADYWRHNDQDLIAYEKDFETEINEDWSLKKVRQFRSAHEKLFQIFIEPRLSHKVSDFESPKKTYVRIHADKLIDFQNTVILQGEPGIGKTRLLKQIGLEFIKVNSLNSGKKYLPVFINNIDLIESRQNPDDLIDIQKAVEIKLKKSFSSQTVQEVYDEYRIVFLIDSIDEFNKANQSKLCSDLNKLKGEENRVFIGTKLQDYTSLKGTDNFGKCEEVTVERFNDQQIRHFLSMYFKNDKSKADNLIESLKENNIIQRLPITPLNLSLISILYEENNFEIPATITDVYDNFNNLLLGRSLADTKLAFFDINFRERVLSVYALEILKRGERQYMTLKEFEDFFIKFFQSVSKTIKLEELPQALTFIIENTGILIVQDGKFVKFMHESYMEYYASREIFTYQRTLENDLIENFLDLSWQYTAIFYAGRSKQMNDFLTKIIHRTNKSKSAQDYLRSVSGLGYILQALYMTDDSIRKDGVLSSLRYILELYDWMKKSSSDEKYFFKSMSLPLSVMINSMFFMDNHNSVTLIGPLELAFDELLPNLEIIDDSQTSEIDSNVAFKLYSLALTLASSRINKLDKMKTLMFDTNIINDPLFEKLLEFGASVAGNKELYTMKQQLKMPNRTISGKSSNNPFNKSANDLYLSTPVGRLRYSVYDRISPERNYLLLTEGKTDVEIIEHAFYILTDHQPYWEINPVDHDAGGAGELAKVLSNIKPIIEDKIVIGIFDNDSAGISQFKGSLPSSKFGSYKESLRIKKHVDANIFGMKLPIPPCREDYYQKEQVYNHFSIEHYFDDELLKQHNMLEETPINNVYKISDKKSKKTEFSKAIRNITDIKVFKNFIYLFQQIDEIFGVDEIMYKE